MHGLPSGGATEQRVGPTLPKSNSLLENEGSAQRPANGNHIRDLSIEWGSSTAAHVNANNPDAREYLSLSCSNDSPANFGWGSTLYRWMSVVSTPNDVVSANLNSGR